MSDNTKLGYNFGTEIGNSALAYDVFYLNQMQGITNKEQAISQSIDQSIVALDHIQKQLADPEKPINIDKVLPHLKNIRSIWDQMQSEYPPELRNEFFEFEGITEINQASAERLITQLEGFKRNLQNELPKLMNKLQLTTQLFTAIVEMHRAMEETEEKGKSHILRRMAGG